jgi:hypothetical protein
MPLDETLHDETLKVALDARKKLEEAMDEAFNASDNLEKAIGEAVSTLLMMAALD